MVEIVNAKTGKPAEVALVDRLTGLPIAAPDYVTAPAPAANARVKRRYARRKAEAAA